jgi:hypothetical protein
MLQHYWSWVRSSRPLCLALITQALVIAFALLVHCPR